MAKKQSFGDKANTKKNLKDMIKLVRATPSSNNDSIRFSSEMVRIPEGKSPDSVVKDLISK